MIKVTAIMKLAYAAQGKHTHIKKDRENYIRPPGSFNVFSHFPFAQIFDVFPNSRNA